jgi:glutamyl-tRNA reductase
VDNAFLFDIDDLKTRVEQNRGERLNEAEKAERMVVDEVGIVRQWLQSLEVTPTIVALRARVDDIKQAELDKTLGRLANLSAPERELVEAMASSIVNKLIHNTMVTLKAEVNSSEGAAFVEAARRFFSLSDPAVSNANERVSSASETCHTSQADIRDIEEVTPRTGSKMSDH